MSTVIGNQEYAPGSYTIDYIEIFGEGGTIDITNFFEEFTITECLFGPGIRGSITVVDALNIISNLPVSEGDIIRFRFKYNELDPIMTKVDSDPLESEFEIIKIAVQRKIKQDVQIYTLQLAGASWTDNLYSKVSKSWNMVPYSDIVAEVYNEFCTNGGLKGLIEPKPIDIEGTDRNWCVISPRWRPWKFINWCASRSYKGPQCDFMFWEDVDKWNFKSIGNLKATGPVATYYPMLGNLPPLSISDGDDNFDWEWEPHYFHIESYQFKDRDDISMAMVKGMLGHHMIEHDLYNKMVYDYFPTGPFGANYVGEDPFSYYEDFDKVPHVDGGKEKLVRPLTNANNSDYPGEPVATVFPNHKLIWDEMDEYFPDEWVRQHESQRHSNQYLRMEIDAIGNFKRRVGDVIKIELMSPEWKEKNIGYNTPEIDRRLEGNWLIVSLRRMFHKEKWHLKMEVIKDEYASFEPRHIWNPVEPNASNDTKNEGEG